MPDYGYFLKAARLGAYNESISVGILLDKTDGQQNKAALYEALEEAPARAIGVPKMVMRAGGILSLAITNVSKNIGQFVGGTILCNVKNSPDFWIFACPLWEVNHQHTLDSGINLKELAVQGYHPAAKETPEANRHVDYIFEMAKTRTLGLIKSNEIKDLKDDIGFKIFKYTEAISTIDMFDDGYNYQIFDDISNYLDCKLIVRTLEPTGTKNIDELPLDPKQLAFWIGNHIRSEHLRVAAQFGREISELTGC